MNAPQYIVLGLMFINLLIVANRNGQQQPDYDIWLSLLSTAITVGLLAWGGFFS